PARTLIISSRPYDAARPGSSERFLDNGHERRSRMDEGMGAKFWWKFAAVMVFGAIVLFIFMMVFTRVAMEWRFFGALLLLGGIGILIGWIHDRRDKRSGNEVDYRPPP